MKRRDAVLAPLALSVLPRPAAAQTAQKVFRIGVLSRARSREQAAYIFRALRAVGYEEGKNVVFDYRFAEGREDKLAELAADLAASKVDLIIAPINVEAMAAKRATSTIPIVMLWVSTPVELGLVASLAHPGGNVTGTTFDEPEMAGKIVQVLRDAVPTVSRVAMLYAPDAASMDRYVQSAQQAAAAMGIRLAPLPCRTEADLEAALAEVARQGPGALFISSTGVVFMRRTRVIEFAALHRLPAIYVGKELVAEGGLMSYGAKSGAVLVRAAAIIDRILKGAKPADIAVEQPRTYELVINLKTAKALGITIPQSLLLRADEVIQ